MRSESWCKTASFIAAFLTVIAALFVFVTGVIEAVVYGQESPGVGAGMFFAVAIAGGIGVMLWWFVSQWCILMLKELAEARAQRERLNKVLLERFYKEDKDAAAEGYLRFDGKQSIKTAELLERIAAALENGSAPAETSSADGAEEPGRAQDAE